MTGDSSLASGGLTATELTAALSALDDELHDGVIEDVALLTDRDDLLVFLSTPGGRRALHIAPGGARARVTTTRRRFPKEILAAGPRPHHIAQLLRGARWSGATAIAGERRATLRFAGDDGQSLELVVELFGNRGLWALCGADGTIKALSRLPKVAGRELRPGVRYAPPAAGPARIDDLAPRFAPPILAAIDAHFTAQDLEAERGTERDALTRALERRAKQLAQRVSGLERQRLQMEGADELRLMADLLLAYGRSVAADATSLAAPDPRAPGAFLDIPRDPRVPPHVQAEALYKRARKAADGLAVCEQQLAEARSALARLEELRAGLAIAEDHELAGWSERLVAEGLLARPRPSPPDSQARKLAKTTGGENFRRFTSLEGYLILVGRDNRQNDRLTTRIARGNDLWLHVGRGHAGSHVVVRVPKSKTASLDTLLDAGTLAIHFSKVRGAELEDVIYTQAKHVRKPKGLPPGRVVPARTKTLRVRRDPERLQRLLSSAATDDR